MNSSTDPALQPFEHGATRLDTAVRTAAGGEFSAQLRGKRHPKLGPALWIFGAFVWTFAVAGEFTTAGFVGEGVATVTVLVVTGVTAAIAVGRSLVTEPGKVARRFALTAALTLALSIVFAVSLVFCLQLLNMASDIAVTLFLLIVGVAAVWRGRGWTGGTQASMPRFVVISLTTATVALSLGTLVHVLAAN